MVTVHFISHDGNDHAVQAPTGKSVMIAALDAGLDGIAADCGGMLTCGTCHVYVHEPWLVRLEAMAEDESSMLDFVAAERRPNSRLSCQLKLSEALDGLTVELPATQY